jgi:predicted RNA-binding Zn ribbon-like protein
MQPVPLDPGDYGGTYKAAAGRIALDFLNTVSWPGTDRAHDWFDRPSNVVVWAVAVGALTEDEAEAINASFAADPEDALRSLRRVHALRADLTDVLTPLAHGERPEIAAVEKLNTLLARTSSRRRVDPRHLTWAWQPHRELTDIADVLVHDAADIVTTTDHSRLGHCDACDWLFLDTTKNRSRRWCDMADCGSRDKASRYYHRHRRGS